MSQRSVRIEETTVATIEGWRVTVGNIMEDRYAGPDGAERRASRAVPRGCRIGARASLFRGTSERPVRDMDRRGRDGRPEKSSEPVK